MVTLTLLCSYPKSGNTWVRTVIDSLSRGGAEVDINDNPGSVITAAGRLLFDYCLGVEASDLTDTEIVLARAGLWETLASEDGDPLLIKVHDALLAPVEGGELPFPTASIGSVVYVLRDPRDVAVSFAHHFGTSIDAAITWMADIDATLDRTLGWLPAQLPQLLSSWSRHVESWIDAPGLRLHIVRYEDMHADPEGTAAAIAGFLGMPADPVTVRSAIAASSFDRLRMQEDDAGFRERDNRTERFFRRGLAGGWRDTLTIAQATRIARDHGSMMQRMGYLP
jgi:hypothetical protein